MYDWGIILSNKLLMLPQRNNSSRNQPSLSPSSAVSATYTSSFNSRRVSEPYHHWSLYHYPKAQRDFFKNAEKINMHKRNQAQTPNSFNSNMMETRLSSSGHLSPPRLETSSPFERQDSFCGNYQSRGGPSRLSDFEARDASSTPDEHNLRDSK